MVLDVLDRRDDEKSLKTRALDRPNADFMDDFWIESIFFSFFFFLGKMEKVRWIMDIHPSNYLITWTFSIQLMLADKQRIK
jgi:hypothetical protein